MAAAGPRAGVYGPAHDDPVTGYSAIAESWLLFTLVHEP